MKKTVTTIITFCLFILIYIGQTGCANIIPPGGGPRDSLPPVLVNAIPNDSSLNVQSKKIVLTFNEYIEVKDVTQNLIVSPLPKNTPLVEHKLKTITIKLRDSLEPNTTYTLDFGNSIQDINEGNPARNFTYVFSTGKSIDSNSLKGKVILAETGLIDTTLIAVLYKNLADTAVIKERPKFIAKIKGDGSFSFVNLPTDNFNLFVMDNNYSKKYDDSTQLFAFYDSVITIGSITNAPTLFAFQEAKKITTTPSTAKAPSTEKEKQLKYTSSLENGRQDILDTTLTLTFNRKIKSFDASKIKLLDTNYKPVKDYRIDIDSSKQSLFIYKKWKEKSVFNLIIQKDALIDTTNATLAKSDTLKFKTKNEVDYGSVKIRFNNLDTTKHPVLLIFKEGKLFESIKITQRDIIKKLYYTGEYDLKILMDKNNNGIWDTGNYKQKKQPEVVRQLDRKLSIRANWDNETDIIL
ncbi:MAG: Ig-like domain-containing protein [Chitinophagaceae bacterium]|jgi:hypothetical protein|nr:Ig-like domain-containing protein [Chitinophagaceae bacterium]